MKVPLWPGTAGQANRICPAVITQPTVRTFSLKREKVPCALGQAWFFKASDMRMTMA